MNKKLSVYEKILGEYSDKRDRNQDLRLERVEEIYEKIPLVKKIDRQIKEKAIQAGKSILRGKEVDCSKDLEELDLAKIAQLISSGYPADYLEEKYDCEKCKDTGFINSEECSCFKQRLAREYYKMSNLDKVLARENFSTFDFNIFSDEKIEGLDLSPKDNIMTIAQAAQMFIRNFEDEDEFNLLFYGSTGLGKTFMTNCIAKSLLDLGHTVVYQTAHSLLGIVEEYKFSKTEDILESKKKYDFLIEADLLIIDDLGTESPNSFTVSEIFSILNSRNLQKKKMIISTNLSPAEIAKTYTDRVYSRILDSFNVYKFIGSDLRWKGY